jgi:hypothetical protein
VGPPSVAAGGAAGPAYDIGRAYEATLSPAARRDGAHYTPPDVAAGLVRRAVDLLDPTRLPRCWDPACGGGAFLVAVAEELVARGWSPADVVAHAMAGTDIDPGAVAAARAALAAWAAAHGVVDVDPRVAVGDGLEGAGASFDLVVGNPPFRSQLDAATARDGATARRRRERFGALAGGYVDDAVLFLVAASEALRPGGVACLVQPRSTLAAAHAAPARAELVAGDRRLVAAWFPGDRVFDAEVDVWAPFLQRGGPSGGSSTAAVVYGGRTADRSVASVAVSDGDWAALAAALDGVPALGPLATSARLADRGVATAGFRDEYYAVLAHTADDEPASGGMRVVTTGLIDPGACRWGTVPARFGKRTWRHPGLDAGAVAEAAPRVGRWVRGLAVPKVLVASQTRVVEAVADRRGDLVPVTPTVAVVPTDPADLDRLVAALVSPPIAAWLRRRRAGSGMSTRAMRVAAADLLDVPLPADEVGWSAVAERFAAGTTWEEHATAMCAVYGVDADPLAAWWLDELPRTVRDGRTADPD